MPHAEIKRPILTLFTILQAVFLAAGLLFTPQGNTFAAPNPPTNLIITLRGTSDFYMDSNNFCNDDEGPDGMWLPVNIANNSATLTYNGLVATITPPTSVVASDPIRYLGDIGPGQSVDVFYYLDYRALRTYAACNDGVDAWYSSSYNITVTSIDNGLTAPYVFNDTFSSLSMISANAGGLYVSDFLGPGVAVGQVFTQDIIYSFGNNPTNSALFLQPTGNGNFNDQCFRIVGSSIISSEVIGVTAGTTDRFYFPLTDTAAGDEIQVQLRWLALCSPGSTSQVFPWAEITSGTQYKYNGAGYMATPIPLPVPQTDKLTITKTVSPSWLPSGGTATYTIIISNTYTQPLYIDAVIDVLPVGFTFTGYGAGSDINASNSTISPDTGDPTTTVGTLEWYGIPGPTASKTYRVPAGGSIDLIYTVSVPAAPEGVFYNSATGKVGATIIGPASDDITVGKLTPTVTTTIHDVAHAAILTTTAGSTVHDSATVAGPNITDPTPTGTVDFLWYTTLDCSGTSVSAGDNIALVAGVAHPSSNEGPLNAGVYSFRAHYDGDANYKTADSACEPLTVNKASPSISTTPSAGGAVGVTLTDTATITGGYNPTGSVTFKLYPPTDPTCTGAYSWFLLDPAAPYATPGGFTTDLVGTWHWTAEYSGDSNNNAALSGCAAEPVVVTKASPTVVTTIHDAGHVDVGSSVTEFTTVHDSATVAGGFGTPTGTVDFYWYTDLACTTGSSSAGSVALSSGTAHPSSTRGPLDVGSYSFRAYYNGDGTYLAGWSACEPLTVTDVLPDITLSKTANPLTVPETGGNVTFTVSVNNLSAESVTLTSLSDDIYGNLNGQGDCVTGGTIAAGGSYSCTFTKTVSGNAGVTQTDTITAVATDNDATTDSATDDATVTVTDVPPTITIAKTPSSATIAEPGGDITFTVVVTNTSFEAVTLTSLTDSIYGNLNGQGTCVTGGSIVPGGTYSCTFTKAVTGEPGGHTNIVTAIGTDDDSSTDTKTDDATVTITNVLPDITVVKTANPLSVPETGGNVTFTVLVNNLTAEAVTLTTLSDNVYGDLNGQGTCATGVVIAAGGSYACTFTKSISGNAGDLHANTVTAVGTDNDGSTDTATDDATVTVTDVPPTITVSKTPSAASIAEPGGNITFTVVVTNTSFEAITLASLSDSVYGDLNGQGTCVTGGVIASSGTYTCIFTKAVAGEPGDHTNIVTAVGTDNDGSTDTATDDATVTITDVLPGITVDKSVFPNSIWEPGGNVTFTASITNNSVEPVTLTSLTDTAFGNLNGQGNCATGGTIAAGGTYTCQFTKYIAGEAWDSHYNNVFAWVADNEGNTATDDDYLFVTIYDSYPFITVTKTPSISSITEPGGNVTFTVRVDNRGDEAVTLSSLTDSVYGNLNGQGTCVTGGVIAPYGAYTCTFTKSVTGEPGGHTNIVTGIASDNEGNTDTDTDDATVTITNTPPDITVTKTADPLSVPETGGNVTFTVQVNNLSAESVTLTSLTDDVYGNLNGQGTCVTGGTIAAGGTYSCTFTKAVSGNTGDSHTDTVTAVATDNDASTDTASDDATVTVTNVPPTITVSKDAAPVSIEEPGGTATFTVIVNNTSLEDVTLTSLTDNVYGDLNGQGTCATGGTITAGGTYTCSFTGSVSGEPGSFITDIVTAIVMDDDGSTDTKTDDATVQITNVLPTIIVNKTANPISITEPGGTISYSVSVRNDSFESVTLTSLIDNLFGDLNGQGDCVTGGLIATGDTYSCSFTRSLSGAGGTSHQNWVTATAVDNDGTTDDAWDDATVNFTFSSSLIIVKNTQGADGTFNFTSSTLSPATFDITTSGNTGNRTFTGLMPGTYGVMETAQPGWDWISAECSDGSPFSAVVLSAGETVTCTFVNEQRGSIVVEKQTIPDGSGTSFIFTGDAAGVIADEGKIIVTNLVPGSYTAIESALAGWDLTNITCDDANSSGILGTQTATFNLEAGETVTCTFINTQQGTIIVDKVTNPAGSLQSFDFTTGGAGYFGFSLTDADLPNSQTLAPGLYSVTETVPAGWDLSGVVCSDGSPITTIILDPGETVTCTFTNNQRGTISVTKVSIGGDGAFDFTSPQLGPLTLNTTGGTSTGNTPPIMAGVYNITEIVPAGWSLTGLVCIDANGSVDLGTYTANIQLDPGEVVPCIFTNTKHATLTIVKDTVGGDETFDFTSTTLSPASFSITTVGNTGSESYTGLLPGTYDVSETAKAGWDPTSATCDNGDAVTAVDLVAGDDVTCTFINTQDLMPDISVVKTVDPLSITEAGGNVTYTYTVNNDGVEAVSITSLSDDVLGVLAGDADCKVGTVLAVAGSCSFDVVVPVPATEPISIVNVFTAIASDGDGDTDTATDDATVTITNVMPDISVTKTADTATVAEPSGSVTFTIVVTNNSFEDVTLTSLTDTDFGDLNGKGGCVTGGTITASGGTYTCSFTETISGNAGFVHSNTVTAVAIDNDGSTDTATDDETVTVTDVLPDISVAKTADAVTLSEPGANVTFTFIVTNNSIEDVTLTSLGDSIFGDLNGWGTCATGGTIPASGGTYTCSASRYIAGEPGDVHSNTGIAIATDDDGSTDTATDDESVTITNVMPDISVNKTADIGTVPETGGSVTYTVVVTNNSVEDVTLTSLTDNMFGDLNGEGTCATGGTLYASGGNYICTFTRLLTGNAGATHTNTVTAVAEDNEGNTDTASDDETVTFIDVMPDIAVTKEVVPASVTEAGGNVTYTFTVTNYSLEDATITSLSDDRLGVLSGDADCQMTTVLASGASCSFDVGPVTIPAGDAPDTYVNVFSATGSDNDGNSDSATDDATVTYTDSMPVIIVNKTANPVTIAEPGGAISYTVVVTNNSDEEVTITSLIDSVFGDINKNGTCETGHTIAIGSSYTCDFVGNVNGHAGSHVNIVTATAFDDEGNSDDATDDATVNITNVLPTVEVTKTAIPASVSEPGGLVTFTVDVHNTTHEAVTLTNLTDDVYGDLNGQGTCATGGTILADGTYSCSFTATISGDAGSGFTDVVTAVVTDNESTTGTDTDDATVTVDNVLPTVTVTKTADPLSIPEPTGNVTYTLVVQNTSFEQVVLTSLTDNIFGDLNGNGTCVTGGTLAAFGIAGDTYTCTFTESLTGTGGSTHTNQISATVTDNDGTTGSDDDDAVVSFIEIVDADLRLTKTVDDDTPMVGSTIAFTVTVVNDGPENSTGIEVTDVLPSGYTFVSAFATEGSYSSTTGIWSVGDLLVGHSATLTLNVTVNVTGDYTNFAQISTAPGRDPDSTPGNGRQTPAEDDEGTVTPVPYQNDPDGFSKALTDTNQPFTAGSNAAIGEILTFTVNVNINPGQFLESTLVDLMDHGMAFVDCQGIAAAGLTTDQHGGDFNAICANPTVDDNGSGDPQDVDRRATFYFGTLTNSGSEPVTLTIIYRAVVLDIAANQDPGSLTNSATWTWDPTGELNDEYEVQIVEPDLLIDKESDVVLANVGTFVNYTVAIEHTSGISHTNAYDVVVTDTLPAEVDFVPGFLDCTLGGQTASTCDYDNITRTVTATWLNFQLSGGTGVIRFRVQVIALPAGASIDNTASVAWTSLPDPFGNTPQSFTPNTYSTERFYDPGDDVNIYGTNITNNLVVIRNDLPGTGFASGVNTDMFGVAAAKYNNSDLWIEIPALDVKTLIVGVPLKNGDWNVAWLWNKVGWLEGSAYPTWNGNSVLTAHNYIQTGAKGPFVGLSNLRWGNQVIIHADGNQYIYEIRSVSYTDNNDLSIFTHKEQPWLTLVTCRQFDQDSGTYLQRVVVQAALLKVVPESSAKSVK